MKRFFTIFLIVLALIIAAGFGVWSWMQSKISRAFTENPVVQTHLGTAKASALNLSQYSAHCQDGCERFTITLESEKGTARAVGDVDIEANIVTDGLLCLANGEVIPLTENSLMLKKPDGSISCD